MILHGKFNFHDIKSRKLKRNVKSLLRSIYIKYFLHLAGILVYYSELFHITEEKTLNGGNYVHIYCCCDYNSTYFFNSPCIHINEE
jgi:hypothetical protein